jgi:hypothetical protein
MSNAASDSFKTELRHDSCQPAAVFRTPYAGCIHVDTSSRDGDAGVDADARPSSSGRLLYQPVS